MLARSRGQGEGKEGSKVEEQTVAAGVGEEVQGAGEESTTNKDKGGAFESFGSKDQKAKAAGKEKREEQPCEKQEGMPT
jgi:hypothetical protein